MTAGWLDIAAVLPSVMAGKGDPNYGDDSDLYAGMGYVRKSARASGLSRKKTQTPPAGGG